MSNLPVNETKLQIDEEAAKRGYFAMSSIIDLTQGRDHINDDLLVSIALQAWNEMNNGWGDAFRNSSGVQNFKASQGQQLREARRYRPGVITALLTPNKLILASSARKAPAESFMALLSVSEGTEPPIVQILRGAGLVEGDEVQHKSQGNCGEILALHLWSIINPILTTKNIEHFRVVTVGEESPGKGQSAVVKAPCTVLVRGHRRGQRGCKEVLEWLKLKDVTEFSVSALPLTTIVGFGSTRYRSITESPQTVRGSDICSACMGSKTLKLDDCEVHCICVVGPQAWKNQYDWQ